MTDFDALRRGVSNEGAFFSPYYLFDLMARSHREELDPAGRDAERKTLPRLFRRATARLEDGANVATVWREWYGELLLTLGFEALPLSSPIQTRHGLVPVSHVALGEGARPVALLDLHPLGTDLDRDHYAPAAAGFDSITRESIARAFEAALDAHEPRWGLLSNGAELRLYRKGSSVARQYLRIEFDALFTADRDDEWTAFWGLLRRQAFEPSTDGRCLLDRVLEESQRHASRIAEDLRENVVEAVESLIQGILDEHSNAGSWGGGAPSQSALERLFEEALYFLYRLLFVLYAESRDILPVAESAVYRDAYSLEHLRGLAEAELRPEDAGKTYFIESVRTLFRMLRRGFRSTEFELPALGGRGPEDAEWGHVKDEGDVHLTSLFDARRTQWIDCCRIPDSAMRTVIRELSLSRPKRRGDRRERYSYADLGVDQLGSVYEGLLVFEPGLLSEDSVLALVRGDLSLVSRAQAEEKGLRVLEGTQRSRGAFVLRAWGGRRKGSGSYYTPQEITSFLVQEALEPLVQPILERCARLWEEEQGRAREEAQRTGELVLPRPKARVADEILELKVCDPAMGSGAFLIQACRYLADAYGRALLAEGRDESGRLEPEEMARFKRAVAERCLYGVDMNPLAVELAKVSLWLETLARGRPLSFLDAHLRCGNSLIGAPLRGAAGHFTVERIAVVPTDAIPTASKEIADEIKTEARDRARQNVAFLKNLERQRVGTKTLSLFELDEALLKSTLDAYAKSRHDLDASDEDRSDVDAMRLREEKERLFSSAYEAPAAPVHRLKEICDLWCAAWFWPEEEAQPGFESRAFREVVGRLLQGQPLSANWVTIAHRVAQEMRFFHWELEFPEVFVRKNGGFDAAIGNPPWDTVSGDAKEFYSKYDPLFRDLRGQAAKRWARALREADGEVDRAWRRYDRGFLQRARFFKESGLYSWYAPGNLGKGDFNVFRVFMERNFRNLRHGGRMTQVLQDSFYLAANCTAVRQALLTQGIVQFVYVFENRKELFPIHRSVKVALLGVERGGSTDAFRAAFFVGKDAAGRDLAPDLAELRSLLPTLSEIGLIVPVSLVQKLSPETWSLLELRSQRDVDIITKLNAPHPPLGATGDGMWNVKFCRELDADVDSDLFRDRDWLEANGFRPADGDKWVRPKRGGAVEEYWPLVEGRMFYQLQWGYAPPDKWVPRDEALSRLPLARDGKKVAEHWRLGWRGQAAPTNERTCISALVPPGHACKDSVMTVLGGTVSGDALYDLCAIFQSLVFDFQARARGATNLKYSTMRPLPILRPDLASGLAHLSRAALVGYPGTPVQVDSGIAAARAKIDAEVAVRFGLTAVEFGYILTTFPLVDRDQPALPGEPKSTITRDLALLECLRLLGESVPKDVVAFFREAGVDIAPITGPIVHLKERVETAERLGAIAYVPSGHATETDEDSDKSEEIEGEAELAHVQTASRRRRSPTKPAKVRR